MYKMLHDQEGNRVDLSEIPNGHLLILGRSGAGKTFFSCRKIEEEIKKGKRIYVLDHSNSYSIRELKKNRFQYINETRILNPLNTDVEWIFSGKDIHRSITDALLRGLRIRSYYQKKLLTKVIEQIFFVDDHFSIPKLIKQLYQARYTEEDYASKQNALHLINHLGPYSEINEVTVSQKEQPKDQAYLTIIQLSDYPELQRKFLTGFLTELFWEEVRYGDKKSDIILLDEFQNMDLKPGSALSAMLRESRKFGLSVYLSTQFMGNYDKETVDTLTQAGNLIFFKPTEREMTFIAKMIDPNHKKAWQNILNKLEVGEAVLKGNYQLNNKKNQISTPIICRVKEEKKYEI